MGVTHPRNTGWPDYLSVRNGSTFLLSCISPAQNQSVWLRRVSWPHNRGLANFRMQSLNGGRLFLGRIALPGE
jgi:hypothetical protein